MKNKGSSTKDLRLLIKLKGYQQDLLRSLEEFGVQKSDDLKSLNVMVRRGMVQTVGDIFELISNMRVETQVALEIDVDTIKRFRNIASHNYGAITNHFAYISMRQCVSKKVVSNTQGMIDAMRKEVDGHTH